MRTFILALALFFSLICGAEADLGDDLAKVYQLWRNSIVQKDYRVWQQVTAAHKQVEVRNRIVSEKLPFPGAVFELPAPPPSLAGLKLLDAAQNGRTAKAAYFGKIDFGVGGVPTDNLLVLSFVHNGKHWTYDKADFVNLTALPDVRQELARGELGYLKGVLEARPSGVVPPTPVAVNPASTIAKVYVFCPGREVKVQINKVSRHRFANAQEAEVVIGGARQGLNEVQFSVTKLDGGTGQEALAIRVYLMSEVQGVVPVKVYEYQVGKKEPVKPFGTGTFFLDAEAAAKLRGGR